MERGKRASIDPKADDGGEEEGGDGVYIYCVTCGHEVQARRAIRHMENCFNKVTNCLQSIHYLTVRWSKI